MKSSSQNPQSQDIKPNQNVQRWDGVILITLFMTCSCYCMQEIPTIHDFLKQQFVSQDIVDYKYDQYIHLSQSCSLGLLIFLASYIGHLSDQLKPGVIILIQTFLLTLSQFLIYLSIYLNNFWFLFVGRMLLFVQCSSLFISTKVLTNNLTSDQQKGLSLGITTTSVSAFGINLLVEPYLVKEYGLASSTFITFLVASLSFLLAIFCFQIEQKVLLEQETHFMEINMDDITYTDDRNKVQIIQNSDNVAKQELGYYDQMKSLNNIYWIFCPISFLNIIVTTVAEVCGPAIISSQWKYEASLSAQINSIGQFMGLAVPFLGYIIDRINRDIECVISAAVIQLVGIILLGFYSPIIGFIVFGIGFNLRISIQGPYLTKIVPQYSLGKAFGLIRSLKDFFGMLVFLYISSTITESQSYENVIYLMIAFCSIVLTLSFILYIYGKKQQAV